ncbi:MAG TPA: outer membrane beta-barrel protein [Gemmatimonadaceae bacterium]|nr:outer membrane beta-barrel protein [Gemmatimonadaceae bacterium]
MKRTLHSLAALIIAAAVPAAQASAQNLIFFAGGGAVWGTGDLSDGTDTGWIGFAGVDYPIVSVPGVAIGVSGIYAHIPYSDVDAATNIPGGFLDVSYLIGATSPSPFKPYLRAGVGVISHRYDPGGGYNDNSTSETKAAGAVGAGINWMMPSVTPFVGVHYLTGGSDTSFFTAYIGLSFGGGGGAKSPMRSMRR